MATLPTPSRPILVVGDIMCDHYVWGDVERISPEAPVQVLRWEREANRPGGAANAAMNLAALGCNVRLVGLIGDDRGGTLAAWQRCARGHRHSRASSFRDKRATTLKTRVIARGQHMLRIDREDARRARSRRRAAAGRRDRQDSKTTFGCRVLGLRQRRAECSGAGRESLGARTPVRPC